jgi:CHAT domain-containing protein
MPRRLPLTVVAIVSCFSAFASSHVSSQTGQSAERAPKLEPGRSIERGLAREEVHRYELDVKQGELTALSIVQQGVDVAVLVSYPDGIVRRVNNELRDGESERLEIVADADGTYLITVSATYPRIAAGTYVIRSVETRTAAANDRWRHELTKLRGDYRGAFDHHPGLALRPLVERALAFAESGSDGDGLEVAIIRRDLGDLLKNARDHARAVTLLEPAAAVFEKILGPEHPLTVDAWTGLASAYSRLGRRPEAQTLADRALAVSEKVLGADHPLVALCLTNAGTIRVDFGDLQRGEELQRRALTIVEKTVGETRLMEVLLINLGQIAIDRQQFDKADELLQGALEVDRKLGTDETLLPIAYQNLGIVARQRKDYATAEQYYLDALALRRKTLAPGHPDIALTLNNLANIIRAKGDLPRSLETHLQVLGMLEKSVGPYDGSTVLSLGNIARTYAALDDVDHALEFQRRVDAAIETQLALNLAIGSERQKLAFVNSVGDRIDRTISLDAERQFAVPEATALAALVVLQRKGRVLDAMTDTLGTVRQRLTTPADRQLLDDLIATTTALARVALSDPQNASSTDRPGAIARLERQKEQLESDLSQRSAEFRAQVTPLTLAVVQAAIPDNAALIEFAQYRTFDPKAESNATAYGSARYVAYVLTRHTAHGVDLGLAKEIDSAVEALRKGLADPLRTDVTRLARKLDAAILDPLRGAIGSRRHLLISPDGALNLVPFEALTDRQGRYAIERYMMSYVSSGRDLVRMQAQHPSQSGAVVVADPLFGEPSSNAETQSAPVAANAATRSITSVDELSSAYFARLGGTALEAERIKSLFPEATLLTRDRATKSALRQLQAPSILHFATHGFFVQDSKRRIPNPLLRSGLALSGANLRDGGATTHASDGILTALEASSLNLWGTKLVTLSACDTGVGEIRNGEGLFGLRRAFMLAGAETLVMSLWPVNDYVTRELMTAYYTGLKQGLGRGEALRKSKLGLIARKSRSHPFYWASFIQAGEWAPLDGRR